MGYSTVAAKGFSWISLLRFSTRIITILRLSILGRLLTPTQFGYFGIASLILTLLEVLTETGINVFLVQEKSHIKEYISSAWVVSIIRGTILAFLLLILTPIVTNFFNAEGAYNTLILMSVVPFIRGFINPAIISYQKDLLFNKEFRIRFILFFVDVAVSIIVAFYTKSAISFVYGLIASALLEVILSYVMIPLWPNIQFEYTKIKRIITKGWWVTLIGVFSYVSDNGDNIMVGRILGTASLGIYQVAYKFSTLPISEIAEVTSWVIFPVYAKFSNEKSRLLKAFVKVLSINSLAALILGGVIYFFAEPLIHIFMGSQWVAAISVIKILAIFGILRTIFGNFTPLFLSLGRQDYVARMTFFRFLGLAVTIVPFIHQFGLNGAGYAMLFSVLMEIPLVIYLFIKLFKTWDIKIT
jgi:O-antigen/teichoic acid export membrane protein